MLPHLTGEHPTVVIANVSEPALDFLNTAQPADLPALIRGRQVKSERAVLWAGDPKLVILSLPTTLTPQQVGFTQTQIAVPANPTASLCADIQRDPQLIAHIKDFAGPSQTVQLIPYATTPAFYRLVGALRAEHGLRVHTPESPAEADLWVHRHIDSKAGFRSLVGAWCPPGALPDGVICQSLPEIMDAVGWLHRGGRDVFIKPDRGQSGIGMVLDAQSADPTVLRTRLADNPYLQQMPVVVEAAVPSTGESPSLEYFIPQTGDPILPNACDQVVSPEGMFYGVLVSREVDESPWYPAFAALGNTIARGLQAMGYVGHFDIDAIVDESRRPVLLEVNARRTGGTHVHEFASYWVGPDYPQQVTLLSHDSLPTGPIRAPDALFDLLDGLLFDGQSYGIVPTITATVPQGKFGCIAVAPTADDALDLQQEVLSRCAVRA
ncbi:MAG: hypothetical protein ACFB51_17690 [Anaerolineae bacterium]